MCVKSAPTGQYLRPGVPQPDHGVDAAGGQEAVVGVWLQAVDDGLVALQDPHQVGRLLLPDEEGAIVRATHDELAFAAEQRHESRRALDARVERFGGQTDQRGHFARVAFFFKKRPMKIVPQAN